MQRIESSARITKPPCTARRPLVACRRKPKPAKRWLAALTLVTLLLIWPAGSSAKDPEAAADSVLVPESLLLRATAVIDSLDLVIAYRDAALAELDSNLATNERFWRGRLASDAASYERVLAASKSSSWDRIKDILVTAGAVYVGAMAVK